MSFGKPYSARNRTVKPGQRWRFGVGGYGELVRRHYYVRTVAKIWYWNTAGCWMVSFTEILPMPFKFCQWVRHVERGELLSQ